MKKEIATHSTRFALFDSENIKLQSCIIFNDSVCFECNELFEVNQIGNKHAVSDDVLYDIKVSIISFTEYMKHLLRDTQQKREKAPFLLKDYAQKI